MQQQREERKRLKIQQKHESKQCKAEEKRQKQKQKEQRKQARLQRQQQKEQQQQGNKKQPQQQQKQTNNNIIPITPYTLIYNANEIIAQVTALHREVRCWSQDRINSIAQLWPLIEDPHAPSRFAALAQPHTTAHVDLNENITRFQGYIAQVHSTVLMPLFAWIEQYHTTLPQAVYTMMLLCVNRINALRAAQVAETNPVLRAYLDYYQRLVDLDIYK